MQAQPGASSPEPQVAADPVYGKVTLTFPERLSVATSVMTVFAERLDDLRAGKRVAVYPSDKGFEAITDEFDSVLPAGALMIGYALPTESLRGSKLGEDTLARLETKCPSAMYLIACAALVGELRWSVDGRHFYGPKESPVERVFGFGLSREGVQPTGKDDLVQSLFGVLVPGGASVRLENDRVGSGEATFATALGRGSAITLSTPRILVKEATPFDVGDQTLASAVLHDVLGRAAVAGDTIVFGRNGDVAAIPGNAVALLMATAPSESTDDTNLVRKMSRQHGILRVTADGGLEVKAVDSPTNGLKLQRASGGVPIWVDSMVATRVQSGDQLLTGLEGATGGEWKAFLTIPNLDGLQRRVSAWLPPAVSLPPPSLPPPPLPRGAFPDDMTIVPGSH